MTAKARKAPAAAPAVHGINAAIADLAVPIRGLKNYPGNARKHSMPRLVESLRVNGQYRPVVVQKSTRHVLAGNGTLIACRELGWTEIAATFVDCDEQTARRIVAVDNRASDLGEYDDAALAELLGGIEDLSGTGYTDAELDALLADIAASVPTPEPLNDPDTVPEPPVEPLSRLGDMWHLGPHRLLVGDSTMRDDVRRLMDGKRADVMVTDPPYGVAFKAKGSKKQAILGDLTQAVIPISFAVAVEEALNDNARLYLFGGSLNWSMYSKLFDHHLQTEARVIIWAKESFVMRPNGYHSQFEVVYFGWKGRGGGPEFWFGDRKAADVWQVRRDPTRERVHPTQKPVDVVAIPVRYSCPPQGLVYEPFGGSGSTLIACQQEGRTARVMELDPIFADVICRRYQQHTGVVPVRDGKPVDFTAAAAAA